LLNTKTYDWNVYPIGYNDMNFVTKWGGYGSVNGYFNNPRDIAIDINGNIYIVDSSNNRIQKFDSDGNFITKWGSYGSGNGQFNSPFGITIDSNDNIYITDKGDFRIQKFDSSGNYITEWGSYGTGEGEFDNPTGIACDSDDNVYVGEFDNYRVQKFGGTSGGGPNNPPVASEDAFGCDTGEDISIPAPGVLANDSEPKRPWTSCGNLLSEAVRYTYQ